MASPALRSEPALTENPLWQWSNPHDVDLTKPYVYFIRIRSPNNEYRYVGKGSSASRMDAYGRNVRRVLSGQPKRPALKRNGKPQSEGNIRFRYVHLVLTKAVTQGWSIEHYPLSNCEKTQQTSVEKLRKKELACNLNDGISWRVEDFDALAKGIT
jgi:hypothetical protein